MRELAKSCDVFLENYKYGDLARYELGYDDLKAINPQIIYCSVTGFGQTGPYKERPGFDFMVQGMGGLMSVTGERDDQPGGGPQRVGVPIVDIMTGMYASIAVCAAIAHRERTGEGQSLDLALLDTQVAILCNQAANFLVTGEAPGRLGNTHPNIVPYQSVKTKDGDIILACGNDNLFNKFCDCVGRPELKTDERFSTNARRVTNRAAMNPILAEIFAQRTTSEWVADAGKGRCALRSHQHDQGRVRGSARQGAWDTDRARSSDRRQGVAGRQSDEILRHPDRVQVGAADVGSAFGRYSRSSAWQIRRGHRPSEERRHRLSRL